MKKNSTHPNGPIYLDCNASTPIEPRVLTLMTELLGEPGNAASRTHEYGARAKQIVQHARTQVAQLVNAQPDEVVFTSGATESDNLAILGLADHGRRTGRRHIVTTAIEHKAVLEPMQELARTDFELTVVPCTSGGFMEPSAILAALRPDTLLVSVMHVNNETGVRQPLDKIVEVLGDHDAYFHVDAAQGFGKASGLESHRIDLMSISSHKIYGPQGVGALVVRRRANGRIPLHPILYGGGHERGFRSGTLPTALIAGLGFAADLARTEWRSREQACLQFRRELLAFLAPFAPEVNGNEAMVLPHVTNVSLHGIDGEAAIVALKEVLAFSNGSACTSAKYEPSHVLRAMGLEEQRIRRALRFSWSHLTPTPRWSEATQRLTQLVQ